MVRRREPPLLPPLELPPRALVPPARSLLEARELLPPRPPPLMLELRPRPPPEDEPPRRPPPELPPLRLPPLLPPRPPPPPEFLGMMTPYKGPARFAVSILHREHPVGGW